MQPSYWQLKPTIPWHLLRFPSLRFSDGPCSFTGLVKIYPRFHSAVSIPAQPLCPSPTWIVTHDLAFLPHIKFHGTPAPLELGSTVPVLHSERSVALGRAKWAFLFYQPRGREQHLACWFRPSYYLFSAPCTPRQQWPGCTSSEASTSGRLSLTPESVFPSLHLYLNSTCI